MEEIKETTEQTQEQQTLQTEQPSATPSWSFVSEEEVAASVAKQRGITPPATDTPAVAPTEAPTETPTETPTATEEEDYDGDLDSDVLSYLSEKLGREVSSFDDLLSNTTTESQVDERIQAIAQFVAETGRDPQDWFTYQQLNPSEMDDVTAVSVKLATDNGDLTQEELTLLINNKYKLDPEVYSEDEVRLAQIQLKMDAKNARASIEELREKYKAPEPSRQEEVTSPINDEWIESMTKELDALEGIEFDLGNGESFTFGLDGDYKSELADKNAHLDQYFDPYVREDGSWDYDKLNMHRAVVDNIETIVQSVYRQGMSDAQRGIVEKAANVQTSSPQQIAAQPNPLSAQLKDALGGGDLMTFL